MMIATNFGVYEIGVVNERRLRKTPYDAEMQIRARRKIDLEALMSRTAGWMVDERKIFATPRWDWPYRIYVSREEAHYVMWNLVDQIDYEFFKRDAVDDKLHEVLNAMWAAGLRLARR